MHVTASGAIDWAIQAGGTFDARGYGIAHDGAAGAYVAGYFYDKAPFGSTSLTSRGMQDAFVMHVASSGVIDWAIQAGGTSYDGGYGIAHDGAGGALVTGYFYGKAAFGSTSLTSRGEYDAFVMHVTASGAIDWAIQAGGTSYDGGYGIAHDGAGGALVTGYFSGEASFGSTSLTSRGEYDVFVMHVTASGAIDWAIQAGGTSYDGGYGIAHDGAGGALVTGYFSGEASFGSTSLTSRGEYDVFVMHVTASGAIDWAIQAGGTSYDGGYGIAHDGAGGALVTGYFSGEASFGSTSLTSRGVQDAFVMHVTASGAIDWAIQAGGTSYDGGYGIAHDGAGGALVTGYFYGKAAFGSTSLTSRGEYDAFVMHVTASGTIDWAIQAGGKDFDEGNGIAHDGAGGALVTGYFKGNASFGSKTLTTTRTTSHTATTCFVASLTIGVVPAVTDGECDGDACDGSPPGLPPLPGGAPSPSIKGSRFHQPPASPFYRPPAVTAPEQPAVAMPTLATSLALLGLLLVCFYFNRRHYRRLADNFRVSRDRAQIDLQLLEHRFKQQTHPPQWEDSHWAVPDHPPRPPSESPPYTIPPGPPSSSGSGRRGSGGGGAGSDAGSSRGGRKRHGDGGSSTAGSDVALDAGATLRARAGAPLRGRDAFSVIYEETIDAVFKADSRAAGLAKLRPYLDANMSKESADAFQECCGKLFVLSRVHTSMAPEVSFAKVQEITDALSRECSMASHTAAPLVAGLKRFVEQRILPNGALDHITEQGFRLPADEVGALLDRYRWPHDAKRTQVLHILRKTLEAVAELRTTSDAAVRGSESIEEARLILNHSHERLVRTMESVLDEHATRADPTLVLGQNLFVAVSRVAQAQEQENVHRLQSRSWPPLHSRVQTVFAEAEARAKAAVKAEAKAKAKVAEEVAMATAKAAAAAEAEAEAETAKGAAKEAAEEANRERLERYEAHEQVCAPLACLTPNPQLKPTQSHSPTPCAGRGGGGEGVGDGAQGKGGALA